MEVKVARLIAKLAHRDQVDKAGKDYFEGHLTRVATSLWQRGKSDNIIVLAYLHDILEDTDVGPKALFTLGCSSSQVGDVLELTRTEADPYQDYIAKIAKSSSPGVLIVKVADLEDHLQDMSCISAGLIQRYRLAYKTLTGIEYSEC